VLFDPVDAHAVAATLRRLGELYAARGDHARLVSYYGRFVDSGKTPTRSCSPWLSMRGPR